MDERAKLLLDKANLHYTKREYSRAVEAYGKYLLLNPADAQAMARLGDCYALLGNKDQAIKYYAKAAELYAVGGSVMKAIGLYKRVLAIDPSMSDTHTYLSYLELSRLEAEEKSGKKTGVPFQRGEGSRLGKPQVSIPAPPPKKIETTQPLFSSPPPPLYVGDAPSPPPAEAEGEFVLEIEPTAYASRAPEPADKEVPLKLISSLQEPVKEEPIAPPQVKKPWETVSIQKQQESLMKELEESGLGPPKVPSPFEILPLEPEPPPPVSPPSPPSEERTPAIDFQAEVEEIEAPSPSGELEGEGFDFQIKVVPETVELPRQKPGEVTVEKQPPREALISEVSPEPTSPVSDEVPTDDYELSLPGDHKVPPAFQEPALPPPPLKPPPVDLAATPIKKSQPSFEIPLLKELTPPEFVEVCDKLKVHRLKAKTLLFRQGDPGDSLFFINSGKIKIFLGAGAEVETLAYLKEGGLFGEFAFLTGAPRQANVITEQETELLELSREDLEPVLEEHPRIREALINFYKERALNNVLNLTVIFRDLGKIEKALVASNLQYKSFKKDEVIIQEGTEGDELYFLITGKVRVTTYHGLAFLADLYPPELFGEISLITNQPRTATVTAATPVEVLYLKKEQLLELLRRYPKIQGPLRQLYESRLQDTADKVEAAKKSQAEGEIHFLT